MKHSSRTLLSLLLVLSLCLGMMPMSVFAETETEAINEQFEAAEFELSQSGADDPADLEGESEGFVVSETDKAPAPQEVKQAEAAAAETADLNKIEIDVPAEMQEGLQQADEDELDDGNTDEASDDLENVTQFNFAKSWTGDEKMTDVRPSENDYRKCVTLFQYDPETETIAEIDAVPLVHAATQIDGVYYVTWEDLPMYANGQEYVYFAKETTVPKGYFESYVENQAPENALEAIKEGILPAENEAVYLKGTILNVYGGESTSFTVTIRWDDNNDQYGNRPAAADYAEIMGLTLWSELSDNDNDTLGLSERKPEVTDNNDGTYTVTWKDLPSSFYGDDIVYVAMQDDNVLGYTRTYENTVDAALKGAYAGGTIVNTPLMIRFAVDKIWQDAENKDNERPESITVRLLAGEEELAEKSVTEQTSWSGTFEGEYPAYVNGEEVEYTIVEDPVEGYRTMIEEVDYAEAIDETDPNEDEAAADENENEAEAAAKSVAASASKATGSASVQTRYFEVTNIKTVDITAIKVWEDDNDADGLRPELQEFAEKYLSLVAKAAFDGGTGSVITPAHPEMEVEAKKDTIVAKASKTATGETEPTAQSKTPLPTSISEDGNVYTIVWEGLDKYRGNNYVGYSVIENPIDGYTLTSTEKDTTATAWTFTNTHVHETCTFSVEKYWEDGDNADGDRPESITLYLTADGAEEPVATLTVTPDENGNWNGAFEGSYPKYKDGEEIKYEISEEPIEGYFTTIELLEENEASVIDEPEYPGDENEYDQAKKYDFISEIAAKEVQLEAKREKVESLADGQSTKEADPVTKYGCFVTNTKVVDVTITKIWHDDNNRDGKRPSLKRFVDAVGLELHAFVGYKDVLIEPEAEQGPVVTKAEDDVFIGDAAYTVTWTNMLKYIKDDKGEYQEARYFAKENLSSLSNLGYSPSRFSMVLAPSAPDQEVAQKYIRGAAYNGNTIDNEYAPEKVSITITKSWADKNNPDRPDSVTVDLLANGESFWEEPKTLSEDNNWTITVSDLYAYENGKPIDYTVEETQIEGYARPDYSKSEDENGNILLEICNSLPADPLTITKRWVDNNNEDGNRPTPEELIESGAFALRRTTDGNGKVYDYPDGFDPEIVDNGDNTYTVTWKDLPKYNDEDGLTWQYSVCEVDVNTYKNDVNIAYGYYLTSSTMGSPNPVDWESATHPVENFKHVWIYNGGSFTNTYQRILLYLDIEKIWDDDDDAHGKRPDSITVVLFEETDEGNETVRTVTITPDEKGEWKVTLKDLQRYRDGEEITYDIEELEVEGYTTTYKNSMKPEPVDPSDPNNPFIDPDEPFEPGVIIGPVVPGDDYYEAHQEQKDYQDALKKAAKDTGVKAAKEPRTGVVIDEIPPQTTFVLERITITNTEYCTATWVDENGTPITPTEDGKFEPVNFPFNAEEDEIPADNLYGDGPEKEGYTFAGWEKIENEDEDGNKTGDITYMATYTQDSIVRYHSNYPDELEKTDLTRDEYYSEKRPYTIADLERVEFEDLLEEHYAFRGWTTSEDGTGDKYAAGDDYPATAVAAGTSAVSFALMGIRSAASSSKAAGDPTIVLELWAQWEKVHIAKWVDEDGETPIEGFDPVEITDPDNPPADDTYGPAPDKEGYTFTGWDKIEEDGDIIYVATYEPDEEENELVTVIWNDYDGTELYSDDYPTVPAAEDYNELSGKDDPTRPEDANNTYTFNGWVKSDGPNGEVIYTAQYTATPKTPTNPGRPNNPSNPTTNEPTEEPTEISDPDTPLAPATVEEEDAEEVGDDETPLAGFEVDPEEDEEVAEEALPFSPFTGDERNTAVWLMISILSLLGIVLVARRRREE